MQDNNIFAKFRGYFQENSLLIGIFAAIQILIIIIVVIIINILNSGPSKIPGLTISDLANNIEGLPKESVMPIQSALYDVAHQNGVTNIETSNAKIREGSLKTLYFERQNINYVNFIVDLPEVKQSYQIFHEWTNDSTNQYFLINNATLAMCLTSDQMIYEDFGCKDPHLNSGQRFVVSEFIKYLTFNEFTPFLAAKDNYQIVYINPVSSNVLDEKKQAYIEQTKEAIRSLGISPDIFEYKVLSDKDFIYRNSSGEY